MGDPGPALDEWQHIWKNSCQVSSGKEDAVNLDVDFLLPSHKGQEPLI